MYIVKNALKNLGRNKGRNLLLGIIMFTLILSTTIALIINATTKEIIEDYKSRFGSKVTLGVDFDKLMEETPPNTDGSMSFPSAPEISPQQYLAFSDSKHLRSFQMDLQTGVVFDKLKAVDEKENDNMVGGIGDGFEEYSTPKAKLLGFSKTEDIPDFKDGLRKIIDGAMYKNEMECLISSELAELNNLKIGDLFQVADTMNKHTVELKVVGIYADATKATADLPPGAMSMEGSYGNRRNEILVDMNTMSDHFEINDLIVNAEYELKSPDSLDAFEEELREKGLPSVYNVETDKYSYDKIVAPVLGLSKVSSTFMWVVLIVGGAILLFITSMAIRERKYEIGVLRAMGMKKANIGIMIIYEMMIITILCLTVGLGIGSFVSQPVADVLITAQADTAESAPTSDVQFNSGSINLIGEDSDVKPLDAIDVSLSLAATSQITLIAIILALLSSTSGVIFITKYEPMKILSDRN